MFRKFTTLKNTKNGSLSCLKNQYKQDFNKAFQISVYELHCIFFSNFVSFQVNKANIFSCSFPVCPLFSEQAGKSFIVNCSIIH